MLLITPLLRPTDGIGSTQLAGKSPHMVDAHDQIAILPGHEYAAV